MSSHEVGIWVVNINKVGCNECVASRAHAVSNLGDL